FRGVHAYSVEDPPRLIVDLVAAAPQPTATPARHVPAAAASPRRAASPHASPSAGAPREGPRATATMPPPPPTAPLAAEPADAARDAAADARGRDERWRRRATVAAVRMAAHRWDPVLRARRRGARLRDQPRACGVRARARQRGRRDGAPGSAVGRRRREPLSR